MNERLTTYIRLVTDFWSKRLKKQKLSIIFGTIGVVLVSIIITFFMTKTDFVPLYSNLSSTETGQIKAELDSRGVKSQVTNGGTGISVPSGVADSLRVDLAAKGIPDSGNIDYSSFAKNGSFSLTDNEFDMAKLAATETELSNLIKTIDGIEDAKVMVTLPQQSVWVSDNTQQASASIVLKTKPGYQFQQNQINALYHLVSKSIPNLPTDNIVITNQNFEYFDMKNTTDNSLTGTYENQQQIKKQIERDIQQRVQQMLGTVMGLDKVVSVVTADIDFTQENRVEQLAQPVDQANIKGIAVSEEKIKETYTGTGSVPGGVSGTGTGDIPSYQAGSNQNGDYTKTEDRINYDVNRIKKTITESPYKVQDLGISVMLEPPNPNNPSSLPQATVTAVKQMLSTIIQTSISKNTSTAPLTAQQIGQKVFVSVQKFSGKQVLASATVGLIPMWGYFLAGGLVLIIVVLLFILLRRKKKVSSPIIQDIVVEKPTKTHPQIELLQEDEDSELAQKRKELEKIVKDRPEEFTKLLRTWLSDD